MRSASRSPKWSIPGVGVLHPGIDRVLIVSTMSPGGLHYRLPISDIKEVAHSFNILTYEGESPHLQSTINLTCVGVEPLPILQANDVALGRHSVMEAEIVFDGHASSIDDALERQAVLIGQSRKPRHRRGFLWSVQELQPAASAGYVSAPTYYFESRKCGVRLKCYIRREKLAGGEFGTNLIVRLEWTLAGKPALVRYFGGNQINDLLCGDLNAVLERNLRLDHVDHAAVGRLFRRSPARFARAGISTAAELVTRPWHDPEYWARGALRVLAHREYARGRFASWEQALRVCADSPAQIRGFLLAQREGAKRRKPGRPKHAARARKWSITDYRINACFRPMRLHPV
jgi:hypothetical protein